MADNIIDKLVVIASSTGGPRALQELIPTISKNIDAPVVVVQHMPKGFTLTLSERLNQASDLEVSEVVDGEILKKGHVYIAKGGKHLEIVENIQRKIVFKENIEKPENGLRPCANITYKSLIALPVKMIVCVVLTGMGADGSEGIKELKKHKPIYTIAQNKETALIYGMPKAIAESGNTDIVLPLDQIGKEINRKVGVF